MGGYVTSIELEIGISGIGGSGCYDGWSEKRGGGGDRLAMSAGGAVLGEILSCYSSECLAGHKHTRIDVPTTGVSE